jgi:hypothetical protein
VFSPLIAGCSLGLHPSRVCRPRPCPGFRRGSSLALHPIRPFSRTGGRLRVSISRGLALSSVGASTASDRAALLGFLRLPDSDHSNRAASGLCVRLSPLRHHCRPSCDLWRQPNPAEADRNRLRRRVLLVLPFRVFGVHRSGECVAALDRSLCGLAARSEFLSVEVAPVLVRRPRFAVGHSLGFAVFLQRTPPERSTRSDNTSLRVSPPSRASPGET